MSLKDYTSAQLRQAISIKERIEELEAELGRIANGPDLAPITRGPGRPKGSGGRTMSADARERIAAAQRARWAKIKGEKRVTKPGRRKMSAAARAKMAAAAKARWAKAKAAGKSRL